MSAYFEKLKDPRWQKLRLKVFERDKWKCLACDSAEETLNVHHLIYTAKEPWDEPIGNLETLCRNCHEMREDFNRFANDRGPTPTSVIFFFRLLCQCQSDELAESGRRLPAENFAKVFARYVGQELGKRINPAPLLKPVNDAHEQKENQFEVVP